MQAISDLYTKLLGNGHTINPSTEVLVTDGAYEALYTAILGHVNPGDEVIIIEPYFDCYEPMVRLAGGIPRFISLKPVGTGYHVDLVIIGHCLREKAQATSPQLTGRWILMS